MMKPIRFAEYFKHLAKAVPKPSLRLLLALALLAVIGLSLAIVTLGLAAVMFALVVLRLL